MSLIIRPVTPADQPGWDTLYEGYGIFYKVTQTAEMRQRVFGWLMDAAHPCNGLVAEEDGVLVGLAHYRPYPSPLGACENGFLDDLFVDPARRGSGAARALIEALEDIGRQKGWAKIRWITADDNFRARGLYDQLAARTMWITYDMPVK